MRTLALFLGIACATNACTGNVTGYAPAFQNALDACPTELGEVTSKDPLWPNKHSSEEGGPYACNRKTNDGGAACSGDHECNGSCLAPEGSFPTKEIAGRCSNFRLREAGELIVDAGVVGYVTPLDVISETKRTRLERLSRNWNMWSLKGAVDYNLTLQQSCFCIYPAYYGPNRVYVRSGKVVSVIYRGKNGVSLKFGERLTRRAALEGTIDEVFRGLGVTIMAASDEAHLEIAYDEHWGFPTSIQYDDPNADDEEYSLLVSDFRPFN